MERKQEVIHQEAQLRLQQRYQTSGSARRARSAVRACASNILPGVIVLASLLETLYISTDHPHPIPCATCVRAAVPIARR